MRCSTTSFRPSLTRPFPSGTSLSTGSLRGFAGAGEADREEEVEEGDED